MSQDTPPARNSASGSRPLGVRLGAWRRQHRHGFVSSLGRLAARPWATALTVLVIGMALTLPLLFHVALDNARALAGDLREAREISVFLKPDLDARATAAFAAELTGRADVAQVDTRTPEQGLAEFRQLSGFAQALDVLAHNPLPSVLLVTPRADAGGDMPPLLAALRADARVDMVQYDATWRHRLGAILGFGERLMQALAVLLAAATLLVVGNTVRLDIQSRAGEIAVLQLIGASNGFVRRPFLYAGLWYGLLGGLLAIAAVVAVGFALRGPVGDLLASYGNRFALHGLDPWIALAVVAASALFGAIGAWIVATRHLRAGLPKA